MRLNQRNTNGITPRLANNDIYSTVRNSLHIDTSGEIWIRTKNPIHLCAASTKRKRQKNCSILEKGFKFNVSSSIFVRFIFYSSIQQFAAFITAVMQSCRTFSVIDFTMESNNNKSDGFSSRSTDAFSK